MNDEKYKKILGDLDTNSDVYGSCIVSRDGMLIYSNIEDIHNEVFAAMLATLLSSSEIAVEEINAGIPETVKIIGKNKKIIVIGAGPKALLAIIIKKESDDSITLFQKTANEIRDIMSDKK